MTTFAPQFTPRWKGTYIAAGIQHTIQMRSVRGATFGTMELFAGFADNMFSAVAGVLADDFEWVSADIALTDSEIFLPATLPAVTSPGTVDWATYSPMQRIYAATFAGKSSDGRARVSMFGIIVSTLAAAGVGGDGLLKPSEVTGLSTVINNLNANACSAGGVHATFHNRATYKCNDHLLKLVRRGTIT